MIRARNERQPHRFIVPQSTHTARVHTIAGGHSPPARGSVFNFQKARIRRINTWILTHSTDTLTMPWFRYRHDIPAALLVFVIFSLQLWCFFSVHNPWVLSGLVAALMVVQVSCGAVCHNHHHVNIFTRAWANRVLETVMYLQTGTSAFSWTIHHNIGHHGDYLNPEKDPASWKNADGSAMHRMKYDFYNAAMIYPEIWKIGAHHPELFARFKRWFLVGNLTLLFFILINPVNALIVFAAPMVIMLVVLLDNTYQQHSGLATHDHLLASRNVEHPFYNFTSWNLGYHTAHHLYPGIHWSQLPRVHAKIRANIPPVLVSQNLIPNLNHEVPTVLPNSALTDK